MVIALTQVPQTEVRSRVEAEPPSVRYANIVQQFLCVTIGARPRYESMAMSVNLRSGLQLCRGTKLLQLMRVLSRGNGLQCVPSPGAIKSSIGIGHEKQCVAWRDSVADSA